jgi:siderophore synthetase component/RimJ/RimL family protein N-acetyltransferase
MTAQADWIVLETLLACFGRELGTFSTFEALPEHDPELRGALVAADLEGPWFRIAFEACKVDVFGALVHASASGRHRFAGPLVLRPRDGAPLQRLGSVEGAFALVERELDVRFPGARHGGARAAARFRDAVTTLSALIEARAGKGFRSLDDICFLAAEQAMLVGHGTHPLAKSRLGFTRDDTLRYSPETGAAFQLCYALVAPAALEEEGVRGSGVANLRAALLASAGTPEAVKARLEARPTWKVLPLHPWQAQWLGAQPAFLAARDAGHVEMLGAAGPLFYATSSVRTVYSPELPFSLKLSLQVLVTNSLRTNHPHELQRGVEVARLLASPWGRALREAVPELRFLCDEGYASLRWRGRTMEGTGVAFRANDFDPAARIAVLAAFCEPEITGPSLLRTVIARVAEARSLATDDAAAVWLDRYVALLLRTTQDAYEHFGLALEIHAQNLLVEIDDAGLPVRLYFRDNQGYFFRAGKAAEVLRHAPALGAKSPCIVPEAALHPPLSYYLFVNNLLGVVEALGALGLCAEARTLPMVRAHLERQAAKETTGFVGAMLTSRAWPSKANLRMAFEDRDEALRPLEAPATYVDLRNPLAPAGHPVAAIVNPPPGRVAYRRILPELTAPLEVRPFDLRRDLGFVHRWVNEPYAKTFWDMAGSLRELEAFYLELAANPHGAAFVGEAGGKPLFLFETYWAPRDLIGSVYEARVGDYGFHMLAGPPDERPKGFGRRAFQVAAEMCFRSPEVDRIVGEADARNAVVDACIKSVGYRFERRVRLPEKEANLTFCTRSSLVQCCPDSRPFVALPEARASVASFEEACP